MLRALVKAAFGLALVGGTVPMHAGQVTVAVDLGSAAAPKAWQVPSQGGVAFRDGELVLDGLSRSGVWAFLREPALSDFTLTCKVCVEPKGGGVRAYALKFHSPDSASHHFVHVNRSAVILGWAIREVEPGKLLMVYDRRDAYPEYGGKHTTAIQGVYITVRTKGAR